MPDLRYSPLRVSTCAQIRLHAILVSQMWAAPYSQSVIYCSCCSHSDIFPLFCTKFVVSILGFFIAGLGMLLNVNFSLSLF